MENLQNYDMPLFQLSYTDQKGKTRIYPIKKKKVLIGSSESCDVTLPFFDISPIHALLEIIDYNNCRIYDLNSSHGTFIEKNKIIYKDMGLKTSILFAQHVFVFDKYQGHLVDFPPVIHGLSEDQLPQAPTSANTKGSDLSPRAEKKLPLQAPNLEVKNNSFKKELPRNIEKSVKKIEKSKNGFKLINHPNEEALEYIFETEDRVSPVFDYHINHKAVEVIILFKDKILSVDYYNENRKKVFITGDHRASLVDHVIFPYLGRKDKFAFIIQDSLIEINPLYGFESFYFNESVDQIHHAEKKASEKTHDFKISSQEIIRLVKGDLQIFIRKTQSPPGVLTPSIFSVDKDLLKFFLIMLFWFSSVLVTSQIFDFAKEEDEEEKIERVVTILHRPEIKKIEKITPKEVVQDKKEEPKKLDKVPAKKQVEKKPNRPVKSGEKNAKEVAAKKAEANKGPKDNLIDKVRPVSKSKSQRSAAPKKSQASASKSSPSDSKAKTQGRVDTYKSADFSASLNSLMAKSSSLSKVKGSGSGSSANSASNFIKGSGISGGDSATLKSAKVSKQSGSLSGSTTGKFDSSRGVEGLVDKKGIYFLGSPSKTVILGSMDPNIIRQILMDHLSQFRYCYQKELDKASQSFDGYGVLDFAIGASGLVTKANFTETNVKPAVVSCVVNVLKGIKFPEPRGGGVVEVRQPLNFQATDS